MIRSKKPEVIDALRRKVGVVYLEVKNQTNNDDAGTVSFDVIFKTPKTIVQEMHAQRTIIREDGTEFVESFISDVERTVLVEYRRESAIYRKAKFYSDLGNVTPQIYDQVLIAEIDRVNKLTPTGNEVQTEFYYYDWTSEDLEIVSEQELVEMQTPKILN